MTAARHGEDEHAWVGAVREEGGVEAQRGAELTLVVMRRTARPERGGGDERVLDLRRLLSEKIGRRRRFPAPPFDSLDHDGEGSEAQPSVGFDLLPGSSSAALRQRARR